MYLYFKVVAVNISCFMLYSVFWCYHLLSVSTFWTMHKIVYLHALDMVGAYHYVVAWTSSSFCVTFVFYWKLLSSVFKSINKGSIEAECLYSSTSASTSWKVLICSSWWDTGICCRHPPLAKQFSLQIEWPYPLLWSNAWINTHEQLQSPPEIRDLNSPVANWTVCY